MKRILIILFTCILVSSNSSQIKPQFGIKLGVNIPNITVGSDKSILIDASNKYGITAGVFLELPLTKIIGISSELFYEQVSTESAITFYSGGVPFYTEKLDVKGEYLSYALKGKINIISGKISPYFTAGGKLSIFLDDKLSGSSSDISETVEIIVNQNFRTLCFYPVVGGGCEFSASPSFTFLTELNFAFPVESFFEYQPYGVSAKPYLADFKVGLKF